MDASTISTPLAALVAGLVTSVHCVGMCGPLACAMRVKPAQYHLGRLVSYTVAGGICGWVGQSAASFLEGIPARLAPWMLAMVLLILALGLEKRLPQPRWVTRLLLRARFNSSLGWLTPLLPCGPLWLMFGVAVVAGSGVRGAGLLAAFVVGTIPLAWLAQAQLIRLQGILSPQALRWTQQSLAMISAALLVWRASFPDHGCCH